MKAAARLLLLLCLSLPAGCDETKETTDGGTPDGGTVSCGLLPDDSTPSCAAITCPAACLEGRMCGRFCGGGDCYTCSNGTWTRLLYDCLGSVCNVDAGVTVPDAGTTDAFLAPG